MDELTVRRTRKALGAMTDGELVDFADHLKRRPDLVEEIGQLVVAELGRRFPQDQVVSAS